MFFRPLTVLLVLGVVFGYGSAIHSFRHRGECGSRWSHHGWRSWDRNDDRFERDGRFDRDGRFERGERDRGDRNERTSASAPQTIVVQPPAAAAPAPAAAAPQIIVIAPGSTSPVAIPTAVYPAAVPQAPAANTVVAPQPAGP